MSKWRISVNWEREYECDDEGAALEQADRVEITGDSLNERRPHIKWGEK